MIQTVSTLCLSCHSSAPRTFPTSPYRMEQQNQSDGRRSLPSSLSIPPYTLHRKLLLTMEDEAATPPTITTVVDRRRQHSEAAAACSAIMMMMLLQQESMTQEEEAVEPKVKKTRTARRLFDCEGAYNCIMRDHLGRNPALYGKEFPLFFRLSRTRVQMILEDLGRLSETSHPFFQSFRVDKLEEWVLLLRQRSYFP